jgi:peptidoglycan/LPS O-acetylase OafA/YrhL
VLVQAYGRQRWARVTWCEPSSGSEALPLLNSRRFLWRRLSRLVPVYYLTNLAALPVFWKVAVPYSDEPYSRYERAIRRLVEA